MPTACPRCGAPWPPPNVEPAAVAHCVRCGNVFLDVPPPDDLPGRWSLVGKVILIATVVAGVLGLVAGAAVIGGAAGE